VSCLLSGTGCCSCVPVQTTAMWPSKRHISSASKPAAACCRSSCAGTLWAASRPYVWVDLTAGPVHYGPGPGHRGQVLDHSLPSLRHLNRATLKWAALPDLAALAFSAVQVGAAGWCLLRRPLFLCACHILTGDMHACVVRVGMRLLQ
jgi:hypothetical protein